MGSFRVHLARLLPGRSAIASETKLLLETLEPRLLLSADPLTAALGADTATLLDSLHTDYPPIHQSPGQILTNDLARTAGAEQDAEWLDDAALESLLVALPDEGVEPLDPDDLSRTVEAAPETAWLDESDLESPIWAPPETAPLLHNARDLTHVADTHPDAEWQDDAELERQLQALPESMLEPISLAGANTLRPAAETSSEVRRELIVVDAAVADYQLLVDAITGADENTWYQVLVLDGDADGVAQISATLATMEGVDAIHLLAHGSDGAVQLGNSWLDINTLSVYASELEGWSDALDRNADLLIYGCNLAASTTGEALLDALADITGTDIAASDDLTGNAALGGDWDLEYQVGVIEAQLALDAAAQSRWQGTLATFLVNTEDDTVDALPGDGLAEDASGNTSLRAAIMEANALPGDDVIQLGAGTYSLIRDGAMNNAAEGDLDILTSIQIVGEGAATIIDGSGTNRVFTVQSGDGFLSLSNLTVQGGAATGGGSNSWGGAIIVNAAATASLDRVVIQNNNASYGAGIYNAGSITATDVVITGNDAAIEGGGLYNEGTAVLERVTVSGNSADSGGGLFNAFFSGTDLTLTNVTISGNSATSAEGGGLYNARDASLQNVTVANNSAVTRGGGIFSTGGGLGTVTISNTIVANNSAGDVGPDVYGSTAGAFASDGFNLIENVAGADAGDFAATETGFTDANLALGALAANGGFTQTHALQAGSIAINSGNDASPPATDQRLFTRDSQPDIGAYEAAPPVNVNPKNTGTFPADNPEVLESGTVIVDLSSINLEDADAAAKDLRLVLTTSNGGVLTASNGSGVTVSGSGTTTLTLSGNLNDLNAYLDKADEVSFTGDAGVTGDDADSITVKVNDDAGSGDVLLGTLNVDIVAREITVTTTADEVDGDTTSILTLLNTPGGTGISLREAIIATNNTLLGLTPDRIILPAGSYTVSAGELDIDDDLLISGSGARGTTVDAGLTSRVIHINEGSATITDLTISGGNGDQDGLKLGDGGGVRVDDNAALTLSNVTVADNEGVQGAGIYVKGTLNLNSVTLTGNTSSKDGGALYFDNPDSATLVNVTISGNSAGEEGGGLWTDSPLTITHATIAFNTAPLGGGIFDRDGSEVTLRNSILYNPGAGNQNSNVTLNSAGSNIDSDGSANLGDPLDGVDPLLLALGDNGGPTDSHYLQGASPAVDPAGLTGAPPLDQRGFARDGMPDIGSVEFEPNAAPGGAVIIDNTTPSEDDILNATNTLTDDDGLGTITYTWQADGSTVGTGAAYTTTQADVGKAITVEASYVDGLGRTERVSSAATDPVLNINDDPVGDVTIDNTNPEEGDLLTATNSLVDEDGIGTITYTWKADGITVGTGDTYTATQGDVGKVMSVEASYTDDQGTPETVASADTAGVLNVNDDPTGAVTINNTSPAVGAMLSALSSLDDEDGIAPGAITFTWQADGSTVGTGNTYTTQASDAGMAITVIASYTDQQGTDESVSSAATDPVATSNASPTGAVFIDNINPAEDDTLTATNTLNDADGIGTITYTWIVDGSAVGTGVTYTVTQADVGKPVTVEASYTDGGSTAERIASAPTEAVTNVNDDPTGAVTIDNTTPADGDVLTASNTLADEDGIPPGAIGYQWYRGLSPILGETGSSYTAQALDVGQPISVVASYTDAYGQNESVSSADTNPVTVFNFLPTGNVTIDNTSPAEDDVLTASNSLNDDNGIGTISYTWKADGATVGTGGTYTLTQADVGKAITVEASYSDLDGYSATVASAPTDPVLNVNDNPTGIVTIGNTSPAEDDTLTASNTLADEDGLGTISYQWFRDGTPVGPASTSYTLRQADVGANITVVASYTDNQGTAESVGSAAVGPVTNVNDAPSGVPLITGTVEPGATLGIDTSGINDQDGLGSLTYQWQRDGAAIPGASGTSYKLVADDLDRAITVAVSYTDNQGTAESIISSAVTAVAAPPPPVDPPPVDPPPVDPPPVDPPPVDPPPVDPPPVDPPPVDPPPVDPPPVDPPDDSFSVGTLPVSGSDAANLFFVLFDRQNANGADANAALADSTVTAAEPAAGQESDIDKGDAAGDGDAQDEAAPAQTNGIGDLLSGLLFAGGGDAPAYAGAGLDDGYDNGANGLASAFGNGSAQSSQTISVAFDRDPTVREVILTVVADSMNSAFDTMMDPLVLVESKGFSDGLDQMRQSVQQEAAFTQAVLGGTVTLTAGFSIGYVVWLARSGVLISAALSALPAWRFMDPLPILSQRGNHDEDDDDESLESLVNKAGDTVDDGQEQLH